MCVSPVGSQDLLTPAQAPLARRPRGGNEANPG